MKFLIVMIFFGMILFASPSFSDIINVPADTSSIQDAISIAGTGDTVLVAEGTYYENINFRGKAITVASHFMVDGDTAHISKTVINGSMPSDPDSGSVVFFVSGEDSAATLTGFTITGGSGTLNNWSGEEFYAGGGILIFMSNASIKFNRIIQNHITQTSKYCYGGGIGAYGTWLQITDNYIAENMIEGYWGGGAGADLWTDNGRIYFSRNIVKENIYTAQQLSAGGGVSIIGGSSNALINGQIFLESNHFEANESNGSAQYNYGEGGAIYIENHSTKVANNIITDNLAGTGGGILICSPGAANPSKPFIVNNTIVGNQARRGGSVRQQGVASHAFLMNCILWGNIASELYNEIYTTQGSLTVVYSDVNGGYTGQGNLDNDPGFKDFLFRLSDTSKCVGSGINSLEVNGTWYNAPAFDYFDNPRPNSADNFVDMGAIESDYPTGVESIASILPRRYRLLQNYPNPFNPSTTIEFTLLKSEFVELKVYNILGKEVSTLVSKKLNQGKHAYTFTGKNLASGIYYYQLVAGDPSTSSGQRFREVKKMILLR